MPARRIAFSHATQDCIAAIAVAALFSWPLDYADASEPTIDCKQYDFVTFLPPSFKEAGGGVHQMQNLNAMEDVFTFANADCVCTNRVNSARHLDFPDTPLEATLTCGTRAEWSLLTKKTGPH